MEGWNPASRRMWKRQSRRALWVKILSPPCWTGKEMVAEGVQLLTTFASCDLAKTRVGKPKAKAKGREELVVVEAAWAEREGGRDPEASVG